MSGKTFNTFQVSVGQTPTLLGTEMASTAATTHRGNRKLILVNMSSNNVFFGPNTSITTSTGAVLRPLASNIPDLAIETSSDVYAVCNAGISTISIAEVIG